VGLHCKIHIAPLRAGESTSGNFMLFHALSNRVALAIFLFLVSNTPAWS